MISRYLCQCDFFAESWGLAKEDWKGRKTGQPSNKHITIGTLVLLSSQLWCGNKQTLDVLFVTPKPTIPFLKDLSLMTVFTGFSNHLPVSIQSPRMRIQQNIEPPLSKPAALQGNQRRPPITHWNVSSLRAVILSVLFLTDSST